MRYARKKEKIMAKISVLSINGKSLEAKVFFVGEQYTQAKATVEKFKGKIGKNGEGKMKATFASVKNAEACKKEFDAWYKPSKTAIREDKPRTQNTAPAPAKGKASSGKIFTDENGKKWTFDTKGNFVPVGEPAKKDAPKRAKGGFDFGSIKGKTTTDKNKALHAVLVGMGMKDSRAKEYQAVWNARPWAK
jgi:hypothetical protein